jgi:hypothetical protein
MICKQADCQHLAIGCYRSILLFVVMIYKQADCRPLVIEGYTFYTIESWVKKRMTLVLNEFILDVEAACGDVDDIWMQWSPLASIWSLELVDIHGFDTEASTASMSSCHSRQLPDLVVLLSLGHGNKNVRLCRRWEHRCASRRMRGGGWNRSRAAWWRAWCILSVRVRESS